MEKDIEKEVTGPISEGVPPSKIRKILKHSNNADEAMKAFECYEDEVLQDEATNKRLLRKIDMNIMPLCA